MMADGKRAERTAEHFDEVEPVTPVCGCLAEVVEKGYCAAVVAAFLFVGKLAPGFWPSAELAEMAVSRLDFDEYECRAVEADQVEFPVRSAAVAEKHGASHLLKHACGIAFSGGAEAFPPGAFPGGLADSGCLFGVRHRAGRV